MSQSSNDPKDKVSTPLKSSASPGEAGPQGRKIELLYTPAESIFAAAAPAMVRAGWSVFPQNIDRSPGSVYNQRIKWSEEHDLKNKLPSPDTLDLWVNFCATLNVACVFGPASGNTFAVDIDVLDEEMASTIVDLADSILGYTPLRREGRFPKIALIYRRYPGDENRIASISRFFAEVDDDGNADKGENGIEIQGEGKLLTFHGRHHKTGRYFYWLDQSPMTAGPEAAPLVSVDQVKTFLEAVDARFRFHRGSAFRAEGATWKWDDRSNMVVPQLHLAAGGAAWKEDSRTGLVTDGREAYLSHLVYQTVRGNLEKLPGAVEDGGSQPSGSVDDFKRRIAITVVEMFKTTAAMTGRWRLDSLQNEARDRVARLTEKVLSGRIQMTPRRDNEEHTSRKFVMPAKPKKRPPRHKLPGAPMASEEEVVQPANDLAEEMGDPELSFLPENRIQSESGTVISGRESLNGYVEPPVEGGPDLSIPEDRRPIASKIQNGLLDAFESFFSDVYGARRDVGYGDDKHNRVHILKAPTGAGKTSRGIRFIAEDPRTYRDMVTVDDSGKEISTRSPIVMLLPTYNNIDELRHRAQVLNLDGTLPDEELRKAAADLGLIHESDLAGKVAELRRDALNCADLAYQTSGDPRGFVTMTYSGKIRAGCKMADKVQMAMAAGIGTAGFCKATVRDKQSLEDRKKGVAPPPPREVKCPYYDDCPAIRQREEISKAHVVFAPHSFLSLSIPEELSEVRAVVADERIHHLFLHYATFSATTLELPRRPPKLTKKEKDQGLGVEDMLLERDSAANIALKALRAGECPAEALLDTRDPEALDPLFEDAGMRWVKSAIRVCSNAIQRDANLSPEMTVEDVKVLCSRPTGRDVREELEFWRVVEDRMLRVQSDRLRSLAISRLEKQLTAFQGEHDLDARIRLESKLAKARCVPIRANGALDHRIQYLTEETKNGYSSEIIRISWRGVPNWLGKPMLLLDASAAPTVIAKIWDLKESNIVVHDIVEDIGTSLNVKIVGVVNQTFSNASIVANASMPKHERVQAAKNLSNVRTALSKISGLYGDGRVVAGTSIVLRKVINNGWVGPGNVDWCHYGAMRGLDMFKFHSAAFSVGRMEVPVRTIDGLVAALTFDDEVPEAPFDFLGTGKDKTGKDLRLPMGDQKLRLRSGHTAVLPVPMMPGKWGRLIQRQYREEELLQFVGRLRPVYREGRTPVWYALSSVIPEELIVDELIHIKDLLKGPDRGVWEAIRETGGVVEPNIFAASCGDIRNATAEQWNASLHSMGFDRKAARTTSREARGFIPAQWNLPGSDEMMVAFIAGYVSEPQKVLTDALKQHLGVDAEVRILAERGESMASARTADTVETAIGTPEERKRKAETRLDAIGEMLLDNEGRVEEKFSVRTFELPAEMAGSRLLSIEEINALYAINDYWDGAVGVADDRMMPILPAGPTETNEEGDYANYENLGTDVRDAS